MPSPAVTPCLLCILDGWGMRQDRHANAIKLAKTPVFDDIFEHYPHARLKACAEDVGLPAGQVGNSEVGHMNIGAGRVLLQDLLRINDAMKKGIIHNEAFASFTHKMKGKKVHLLGMISSGGVHGHIDHVIQLIKALHDSSIATDIHAILDGRDTAPMSAIPFMKSLCSAIEEYEDVHIRTVSGRYYVMDRDRRWDRIERAWRAIVMGDGEKSPDPIGAIQSHYDHSISDEFIPPTVIGDYCGVEGESGLMMSNFRADRVRQILLSLLDPEWEEFHRPHENVFSQSLGMTDYSLRLNRFISSMFPPHIPEDTLGSVLSGHGLKQLRLAETEKYAHVTYFFNGGREEAFEGEEHKLIASPRVATYDEAPRMSARLLANATVSALRQKKYALIVLNFANPDMVGHTGNLEATIKAVETVDKALGQIISIANSHDVKVFVTADHGNAEQMMDSETGQAHTFHTLNPVPFIFLNHGGKKHIPLLQEGRLADIAPTLLDVMGLKKPNAMSGHSLLAERIEKRTCLPQKITKKRISSDFSSRLSSFSSSLIPMPFLVRTSRMLKSG